MTVYCVFWVEASQFLERIFIKYEDALEYASQEVPSGYGHYNIESWDAE